MPSLDGAGPSRKRVTARIRRQQASLRRLLAFSMAVLAPVAAVLLNAALTPVIGHTSSIPTIAAVVIVAWLGGLGPGLVATAIALALEILVVLPPYADIGVASVADRLHLVLLAGTLLLIDALAWLRAKAERGSVAARREAEDVLSRADVALRRLEALQHLATDLGDADSEDQILKALLSRACVALRADRCVVGTLELEGGAWQIVDALMGESAGEDDATRLAEVDPRLVAVVRDGERLFDEGRSGSPHPGIAVAAVPLRLTTGPGVLAFMWGTAHPLPVERQAFIEALARAGSAALDRHRMFAAEVAALRRAEAATGFLNVLADAGRTLGTTLDYEELVARLPGLGVPQLGDVGILDLEEGEGQAQAGRRHSGRRTPRAPPCWSAIRWACRTWATASMPLRPVARSRSGSTPTSPRATAGGGSRPSPAPARQRLAAARAAHGPERHDRRPDVPAPHRRSVRPG
ncbi:MAG: DUF4118 domain-containing protein [Chloroflexota bacterium]